MIADFLQDRAALYVSGAMTPAERENFELVLEFQPEVRAQVAGLQEAMAVAAVARTAGSVRPPPELKTRLLAALGDPPPVPEPESLVVTDPAGLVQWVNPAFTAMCGYTLDELKGRKPGHLLQGPATDRTAVERLRVALQARQPCRETLLNYHKDGTTYHVDIRVAPVLDDAGQPCWLVARERKVPEAAGLTG